MSSITALQEPIKHELILFEKKFKEIMKSSVPLLDRITYYIVQRKGKQLRPMLVLLCAKMNGATSESQYIAASMVELLHTATLVHDDVVDDSNERRGFFSVNALWKNKIAVLVGDYFFAKGLLIALDHDEFNILKILSHAVREMSEGELLQIEKSRKLDIDEETYLAIIRQKTASMIACSCEAGVASATEDINKIMAARKFGLAVGMAFQIKDDLFDYGYANVGKPTGNDIKEKKMTLPLIHALSQSTQSEKRHIIHLIKKSSHKKSTVAEIIAFVTKYNGLAYAEVVMNRYKDDALLVLEEFEDSPSREALSKLVSFVVNRNT